MTFHEVIVDLKRRYPDSPIGETAIRGQYYDRAVGLTDYSPIREGAFEGHGENGRPMWIYYSEAKNVICCGDKTN